MPWGLFVVIDEMRIASPTVMNRKIYMPLAILFVALFSCILYLSQQSYIQRVQGPSHEVANLPSLPRELIIPKIDVETHITEVGLTDGGKMDTPEDPKDAGWYKFGVMPGAMGSAVLAGHLDNEDGSPAAFYSLSKLASGDDVYVLNDKGEKLHFKVTGTKKYPYDAPDTKEVFGPSDAPRLNLITCHGTWLKGESNYDERLVVFTEFVSKEPGMTGAL